MAPSTDALIASRALQGIGAAMVTPLTLTLLSEAFPAERRGAAIGIWSGVSGLGVAVGPLVGGAVVDGISWQWIFWLNVPVGLVLVPLAARMLTELRGPSRSLDLPGVVLGSLGLVGVVYGLAEGNALGWGSPEASAPSPPALCSSPRSSRGRPARRSRWSRCASSATAGSRPPTRSR